MSNQRFDLHLLCLHAPFDSHFKHKLESYLTTTDQQNINKKNALQATPLDELIAMLIMRQEYYLQHPLIVCMQSFGFISHRLPFFTKPDVAPMTTDIKVDVAEQCAANGYYDLHWIIIRQVRRFRSKKYRTLYSEWPRELPKWYETYYDYHELDQETNAFGEFWTKEHEWKWKTLRKLTV